MKSEKSSKCKPVIANGFIITTSEDAQQVEYFEPINAKLTNKENKKEKPGFFKLFFREKKCNNCLQKKRNCTCKVRKKKVFQSSLYTKDTVCEQKTRKETQRTESHPPHLEVGRRGCGCQFYFCVDSKPKKNGPLHKKVFNNNKIPKRNTVMCFSKCVESEAPKLTILCEEEKKISSDPRISDDVKAVVSPDPSFTLKKDSNLRHSSYSKYSGLSVKIETNTSKKQNRERGNLEDSKTQTYPFVPEQINTQTRRYVLEKNSLGLRLVDNDAKSDNDFDLNFDDYNKKDNDNEHDTSLDEYMALLRYRDGRKNVDQQRNSKATNQRGILRPSLMRDRSQEKPRESSNFLQGITLNVDPEPEEEEEVLNIDGYKKKTHLQESKQNEPRGELTLTALKDTNPEKKKKHKQRKSGLFVKNSLISLRKERRTSQLASKVSQILMKLNYIEHKISDIKKKCANRDKNITMGISCEPGINHSRVSIKFKEKKETSQNNTNLLTNTPYIKAQGDTTAKHEGSYITTTQAIKVKQNEKSKGKRTVCHCHDKNAIEVHKTSLQSKPNTRHVKCFPQQLVIACPQEIHQFHSPVFHQKWRRISEELKISQPVVKRTLLLL